MKKLLTLFISSFLLFGCITKSPESKRITREDFDKQEYRDAAKRAGMSYVDYLHMINNKKKNFPTSQIKYRHTIEKQDSENSEIIHEEGFFCSSGDKILRDKTLNIDEHIFFIDSKLKNYDYYVEILDSLFRQDENGIFLKASKINGDTIYFDEEVFNYVASRYRLLRVQRNEYTQTIISCINYEITREKLN